ncbi:MAG: Hpt domain-containing protein [Devosia sp.]
MAEPLPFEIKMAALREHFTTRACRDGVDLRVFAGQIGSDAAARTSIDRIAHGLAGAAAVFGMPQVSQAAALLEEAVAAGAADADIIRQSLALSETLARLECQSA